MCMANIWLVYVGEQSDKLWSKTFAGQYRHLSLSFLTPNELHQKEVQMNSHGSVSLRGKLDAQLSSKAGALAMLRLELCPWTCTCTVLSQSWRGSGNSFWSRRVRVPIWAGGRGSTKTVGIRSARIQSRNGLCRSISIILLCDWRRIELERRGCANYSWTPVFRTWPNWLIIVFIISWFAIFLVVFRKYKLLFFLGENGYFDYLGNNA